MKYKLTLIAHPQTTSPTPDLVGMPAKIKAMHPETRVFRIDLTTTKDFSLEDFIARMGLQGYEVSDPDSEDSCQKVSEHPTTMHRGQSLGQALSNELHNWDK